MNKRDHATNDHHTGHVALGAAKGLAETVHASPHPTILAGHVSPDSHENGASQGPAISEAPTKSKAPGQNHSDGHSPADTHSRCAAADAGGGPDGQEPQVSFAAPCPLISEIRELHRRRVSWHKAEKSLTLQAKAYCRRIVGGDKKEADALYQAVAKDKPHDLLPVATVSIAPLLFARDHIEATRRTVEKRLEKLAKELPVADFVNATRGFSWGSLAAIVGECGDLSDYKSVSAVWKRMGLAVINGGRQRRVAGAEALEHGYSPERRSIMWNIGDCLIKAGNPDYRPIYDARKAYELERVETKGHAHNRAKRYIEKRLLRELVKAWRRQAVTRSNSEQPSLAAAE